jgi:iron complex outermembrane receptor protein
VNPNDNTQIYAHWTRGFRSGGYNLRNTATDLVNLGPGPFDEETVDSYEFGFKTQFEGGRITGAIFSNSIEDMQREVNLPDPVSGVLQVIKNTANADIRGAELDGTFSLWEGGVLMASLGWTEAKYTKVAFDLNGDGTLDEADESLNLPRAPKITWSIGLTQDFDIGEWGVMTARANYAHRDRAAYTDNNLGYIGEQDILDAGLDFYSNDGHWVFSLYGKNLTDEVKHGGDTQLPGNLGPFPLGGTFSPLAKGRVIGLEVTYSM